MSLAFMLMMMVIFSVISAGFFYASRVPAIQAELEAWTGGSVSSSRETGRLPHIVFIMFTFTSPLLLAGFLSTALAVLRWFQRTQ